MKTRFFAFLLALSLTFALCACADLPFSEQKFTRGTVSGSTYVNEFSGIRCELPEGWTFSTEEELSELYGEPAHYDENGDVVDCYDAMAQNGNGASVLFTYENIGLLYAVEMSEEDYLSLTLESLRSQLAEVSDSCACDLADLPVKNGTASGILSRVDTAAASVYSALLVKKVNTVISVISVSALTEADCLATLSCISL